MMECESQLRLAEQRGDGTRDMLRWKKEHCCSRGKRKCGSLKTKQNQKKKKKKPKRKLRVHVVVQLVKPLLPT